MVWAKNLGGRVGVRAWSWYRLGFGWGKAG